MFLKKIIKKTNLKFSVLNFISPILKKGNKIIIYFYRFSKNRLELLTTIGTISSIKKRNNHFKTSTLVLKQKLYGITIYTRYQLNNISLLGIRLIKY